MKVKQFSPLSLVEANDVLLSLVEVVHSVAPPALLCHKELKAPKVPLDSLGRNAPH